MKTIWYLMVWMAAIQLCFAESPEGSAAREIEKAIDDAFPAVQSTNMSPGSLQLEGTTTSIQDDIDSAILGWGKPSIRKKLFSRTDLVIPLVILGLTDPKLPKRERGRFVELLWLYSWEYDQNKVDKWLFDQVTTVLSDSYWNADVSLQSRYLNIFSHWQSEKFLPPIKDALQKPQERKLFLAAIGATEKNRAEGTIETLERISLTADDELSAAAFSVLCRITKEKAQLDRLMSKRPSLRAVFERNKDGREKVKEMNAETTERVKNKMEQEELQADTPNHR